MNKETRAELVARVCRCVFDNTEDWDSDYVGTELAYLLWAIVDSGCGYVDWHHERSASILHLFESLFDEEDPVWGFIEKPNLKHFVVFGHMFEGGNHCMHISARTAKRAEEEFTRRLYSVEGEVLPLMWPKEWSNDAGEPVSIVEYVVEISEPPLEIHPH